MVNKILIAAAIVVAVNTIIGHRVRSEPRPAAAFLAAAVALLPLAVQKGILQ